MSYSRIEGVKGQGIQSRIPRQMIRNKPQPNLDIEATMTQKQTDQEPVVQKQDDDKVQSAAKKTDEKPMPDDKSAKPTTADAAEEDMFNNMPV